MSGFADRVRIKSTDETRQLGLADREGHVFGWTSPSSTGVTVIGTAIDDQAVNVHFDELGEGFWFSEDLVQTIDRSEGTVVTLDGVDTEWVRLANGDWQEQPRGS